MTDGARADVVRKVRGIWIGVVVALFIGLAGTSSGQLEVKENGQQLAVSKVMELGTLVALVLAVWAIARMIGNRKRTPLATVDASAQAAGAGWFPDTEKSGRLRYWDGQRWTDHFSDPDESPGAEPVSGVVDQVSEVGETDVAGALRQLKALHAEGLLTSEEYEAKRQRLAEQL
ncbi:DUF2510 domain-containing protein [Gemmatimonas sp.]|uniref:DUF2510 domain-containing protein n=1 Tax=Gemmatimonas sp. TaxID=1962908 RepID=UPI00356922EE